jgi:acetoin:2,6-dichlorophenolindophenol oxidoreductase subunit alpha
LNIPKERLVEMYRMMCLIRNFEYTLNDLYSACKIVGDLHLYVGEEAVAVGVCCSLRKDDYILTTHRGHGYSLAKGADVNRIMAEFFGKSTGICKGKGGSMHLADVSVGLLGATGIVGGGIPLATGAAFSAKYRGTDQVAVGVFGDGASNQGTFHESLNLASIWDLPVVYICENNQYAESTHVSKVMKVKNIADRAVAYAMPGIVVDGMDVTAVYQAVSEAVARARKGSGPTLIECKTYRFEGHEIGDPQYNYRTKQEVDQWKAKCPIRHLRQRLIESRVLAEKELDEIDQDVKQQLESAVKFARESPDPDPQDAFRDIFVSSYF